MFKTQNFFFHDFEERLYLSEYNFMFKVKQFKLYNNDKNNNPVFRLKKNRWMLKNTT